MLWQWVIHWPGLVASRSTVTVRFGVTMTVSLRAPPPVRAKVCAFGLVTRQPATSGQSTAGTARAARARQIATTRAPRPNTDAANQSGPPRMGISAKARRIAQPMRNAATHAVGVRRIDRPRIHALALYPRA